MAFSTRPSEWLLVGLLPVHTGLSREEFPLLSAKVHYDLADVQMLANLTQTYTSNASIETEIRYVFPLPDASVCAFKAVIDDNRTIEGVVKEKEQAKAEYEQAIAQGHTAAVLEQENVEIFQVSLGNIRPKQKIEVHISFVTVVTHDGTLDSLRLTFPSTIAPRYGTPPAGLSGSYTFNNSALDLSVAVEMTSHIKSISSPSHPIAMKMGESTLEPSSEFDPTKARVSLTSPTLLEKDIVMVLTCQGLDKPRCIVESFSPEEGAQEYTDAYALTLVPRFELPALPSQEYIFLVDRSGSMGGGKMDAVRSALQILLMSLPSRGTCFNIMSFGSHYSSLWPSSVTYSAESVKAASAHVDTMTSNYGGTEIRSAVLGAFNSRVARAGSGTTATSIFVLTDGEAYDLDGVKSSIAASVKEAKAGGLLLRIFCMGIGNTVSKAMCEVIARAGRGTTAFVGETEKPDQKLMGLLRAARGPALEDVSIDWGVGADDDDDLDFEMVSTQDKDQQNPTPAPLSLFDESQTTSSDRTDLGPQPASVTLPPSPRLQQAPATASLPSLYPGFRTSLFAIVKRGAGGNTAPSQNVHIKGSVLGRPVMLTVPVAQATALPASTKLLHALAARALIQSLEESGEMFMSQTKKAEVLRLAERYGLASSQTSFIAVDHDQRGASVDRPLRTIPVTIQSRVVRGGATLGLFGSMPPPPPPPRPGVSLFGSFASAPPPVFGAPRLGGGQGASRSSNLFGGGPSFSSAAPTMQPFQQQQQQSFASPGGGGLFGNAQVPQSAPPQNFGSSSSNAPRTGGLFGAAVSRSTPQTFGSSSPKAPRTGGGLFGAASYGSSPPGATPLSGGLFGNAPAAQAFSSDRYSSSDLLDGDFGTNSGNFIQFGAPSFGHSAPSATNQFSSPAGQRDRDRERTRNAPSSSPMFGGFSFAPQAEPAGPGAPLSPSIESFARLQAFDGSFAGSAPLFQLLVGQTHAPVMPTALEGARVNKETVWCTLLSVAYLEIKFAAEKDVWAILVEKAMDFVQDTLQGVGDVQLEELKQAARRCIV